MLYSFDIFDTLVTRRVATPRGVFVYLQRRLLDTPEGLPIELCRRFVHERQEAEYSARVEARMGRAALGDLSDEVDLADIYRCLGRRHGLGEPEIARLMELELSAEAACLYAVPKMLARFRALASRGERIVLISDMYLRRQDIQRLIDGIDPFLLEYAPLYLSSEVGFSKASGRLFEYVAAKEGVLLSEICHIGDNPVSDVRRPREKGCRVTLFDDCHLTLDEMFAANEEDFGWQVSVGLFRESRLCLDSARSRLGAIHAAPLLLPFVHWVVERARALGRRRLYFLAPGGQVLREIAQRLGLEELELRDLHVSRAGLEHALLLSYLDQECLTEAEMACLIDIGWTGSTQDALHAILGDEDSHGAVGLLGLYWGLMDQACLAEWGDAKLAFAVPPGRYRRDPTVLREIIECFTAADHGNAVGYTSRDGVCSPVLDDSGLATRAWGLGEFRAGIGHFVDRIGCWLTPGEIIALMPYYVRRLEFLVVNPSKLLARELGSFPFWHAPTGRHVPFAPSLSLGEALGYHLSPPDKRRAISRWRHGSLFNSKPLVRLLFAVRRGHCSAPRPRDLTRFLPYPMLMWLKTRLPTPMLKVCRALLRM